MDNVEHYFENCLFRLAKGIKDWKQVEGEFCDTNVKYIPEEALETIQKLAWYIFELCDCDTETLKLFLKI